MSFLDKFLNKRQNDGRTAAERQRDARAAVAAQKAAAREADRAAADAQKAAERAKVDAENARQLIQRVREQRERRAARPAVAVNWGVAPFRKAPYPRTDPLAGARQVTVVRLDYSTASIRFDAAFVEWARGQGFATFRLRVVDRTGGVTSLDRTLAELPAALAEYKGAGKGSVAA